MFNSEKELVQYFLKNENKKKNTIIFVEVDTNYGRPDIVIVNYDETVLNKRISEYKNVTFERLHSYALAYLYKKRWVKVETLKNFLNISLKRTEKIISDLKQRNLIEENNHLIKIKKNKEVLVVKRIKVFEAKLANWKYVIEQAERHLWFTNESSVLLPDLSTETIFKSKKFCEAKGIGLTIAKKNKVVRYLSVQKPSLINTPLLWEINERIIEELRR